MPKVPEKLKKAISASDEDGVSADNINERLKPHKRVIEQVNDEYQLSWRFTQPKREEWFLRLKIYNNQKRNKKRVGDNLMFSVHQTVLASLYNDQLKVAFEGRTEGADEQGENLTALADYDRSPEMMNKDMLDYEWDWDATFFGRGYCLINDFDTDKIVPLPEIIDPLTFVYDPRAVAINGNARGFNAARFFGRSIRKTRAEMESDNGYINLDLLDKEADGSGKAVNNLTSDARQARRSAQGFSTLNNLENNLKENFEFEILQWFTHLNGKKFIFEVANERNLIIRVIELGKVRDPWPVAERTIFPISHTFNGVSVSDLVEDKQRLRAVLLNLGIDIAKSDMHPMYLFDQNRIRNKNALNHAFNKHIPVDGTPQGAVEMVPRKKVSNTASFIMQALQQAAEQASAIPSSRLGSITDERRTLGEVELATQGSGQRLSLPAKIFGWSERRFWRRWYDVYDEHFGDKIGKKVARVQGPFGPDWRELARDDIIVNDNLGPYIEVESSVVSNQEKVNRFINLQQYFAGALQLPGAQPRYAFKKLNSLVPNGLTKAEFDRFLPPTIDELEAEEENEKLSDGEKVPVKREQNHRVHLELHSKANDTEALRQHIAAHKLALRLARKRPDLFPGLETESADVDFNRAPAPRGEDGPQSPEEVQSATANQVTSNEANAPQ